MHLTLAPLAVALIGLLVYVLSSNPKASELGRILFAVGMLVATAAGARLWISS